VKTLRNTRASSKPVDDRWFTQRLETRCQFCIRYDVADEAGRAYSLSDDPSRELAVIANH
jgi:hypothetical protein